MAIGTTLKIGFDGTSVSKGLSSLASRIAGFGSSIAKSLAIGGGIGGGLGIAGMAAGVVSLGKEASSAASRIENMKAQFELFVGSAEKTDKLIQDLRQIAIKSPLELVDISDGARNLLTYGVAAEKVAGIVDQLSEVSAGSAERFGRISYAFGQITSIGRLMGTELRQLTEAGFNPLEFISRKTGESMLLLRKRMEDGKVTVSEVEEALKAATSEGGRFFGLNEKMSQTFTGRISMMKDQWTQLTQGFGLGMNEGLKKAADAVTNGIPQFIAKATEMGKTLGDAISEAVNGNYEKFVAIGEVIGGSIWEGVMLGVRSAARSTGAGIVDMITGGQYEYDKNGNRKLSYKSADASQENAIDRNETLRAIMMNAEKKDPSRVGMVPGYPNIRYAREGESTSLTQGGIPVILLKKIEENTRKSATGGSKL